MTDISRVRTQAERATDDHTWRRDLIGVRTADGRVYAPEDIQLVYPAGRVQDAVPCRGCHACATDEGEPAQVEPRWQVVSNEPDADIWMTTGPIAPPRRRWWHRLTRRAL